MAKAATKSTKAAVKKVPTTGPVPLYAVPIYGCIASGNVREMKSMATKARKHITDVQGALAKLDQAIAKSGGAKR